MTARLITKATTIEELAALVCTRLADAGISVVLTGGAVVSIYSDNEYMSYDLDFIVLGLGKKVDSVMSDLGFSKNVGRHFVHPNTPIFVEFPGGTLAIGESLDTEVVERISNGNTLRLLSPTDCVKDRLAAYYHWNDKQGLDQALAVARKHPISIPRIRKWSKDENMSEKFKIFLELHSKK